MLVYLVSYIYRNNTFTSVQNTPALEIKPAQILDLEVAIYCSYNNEW